MEIGGFKIGLGKTFVIAEVGNNHNGEMRKAYQLIDNAVLAGADAVKFQMRDLDNVYRRQAGELLAEDLSVEYVKDLLERFELSYSQHQELKEYCDKIGIIYFCTPWDLNSLDMLESLGVVVYKIASADLTNIPLVDSVCATGKPLLLSTGMHSEEEILKTYTFLEKICPSFCLLHCNSTYPAPFEDINLRYIKKLQEIHNYIGYSGHERGIAVSLSAVALGACVIERHITLDRQMEGPDHAASLELPEFKSLVTGIREVEMALGNGDVKKVSQGELINKENLGKSLVASRDLLVGQKISPSDIDVKSPGRGLSPQYLSDFLGRSIVKNINKGDFFYRSHIQEKESKNRVYGFDIPWGVPVRYHDFSEMKSYFSPDLWEFHLSYKDMDVEISSVFSEREDGDLVVHAPELLKNSALLDITSLDTGYRTFSIRQLQRVIDITRDLSKFFKIKKAPSIVVNVGGFSMDEPLTEPDVKYRYEILSESLSKLDSDGVLLLPQTMAPFPWHFGGQRYQNLFVNLFDLLKYGTELRLHYCFDVSHSFLHCNDKDQDFYVFTEKLMPFVKHLHIADASGTNGEGLQIGEGEIDFERLGKILRPYKDTVSFIPEIWQGHSDSGHGFRKALEALNGKL